MNTQITENYVSFETAKLLKEKGFDCKCEAMYDKDGYLAPFSFKLITKSHKRLFVANAPTVQMAMKWLREVYNIFIDVCVSACGEHYWLFNLYCIDEDEPWDILPGDEKEYDSYEQACEAAIKYCLTNLI